jgi:hypothetical protein
MTWVSQFAYFFDGDFLVLFPIKCGGDHPIGPRADLFDDFVFFVDNEGGASNFVEDSALGNGHFAIPVFFSLLLHNNILSILNNYPTSTPMPIQIHN